MNRSRLTQTGSVTVIALIVLNLSLLGVAGWLSWGKFKPTAKQNKSSSTVQKTDTSLQNTSSNNPNQSSNSSMLSSLQIASRNTQRKDDASMLLGTVEEYINNNSGQLPTGVDGGQIHGDQTNDYPSPLPTLSIYTTATLVSGPQASLDHDALVIVTEATCGQDGATITGSSRDVVLQYGVEQSDGSFKGACESNQ